MEMVGDPGEEQADICNGAKTHDTEKDDNDDDGSGAGGDNKRVKKAQRVVKTDVHVGQARMRSILQRIGSEVKRGRNSQCTMESICHR
jgi:hypothetical protein